MHQEQITVLSVRKDGKGFKANLTGEGEQWLSIPPNLVGKITWKETYQIGWTKTPRQDGGFFYNLKQLGGAPNGNVVPMARPAAPLPVDKDKHIGTLAFLKTFGPIYAAQSDAPINKFTMAQFGRQCMAAYDMSLGGQNHPEPLPVYDTTDPVDDIGDTF